jgi:hypothetical protein
MKIISSITPSKLGYEISITQEEEYPSLPLRWIEGSQVYIRYLDAKFGILKSNRHKFKITIQGDIPNDKIDFINNTRDCSISICSK